MNRFNIHINGRIRIFIVLILLLISTNIFAQTKYKTVKEAMGLKIGDRVNNFSALDLHNELFTLEEALRKGPVVVIFYRGHWCPICNRHLGNLQDSLLLIYEKGATVVAISPEKPEFLKQTAKKTNVSFSLLYDAGYKISDAFDVSFQPNKISTIIYNSVLGANLKSAHSDETQRLPIPATFIIGQDRKIIWRHFDPDYKQRSSVKEIIEVLK